METLWDGDGEEKKTDEEATWKIDVEAWHCQSSWDLHLQDTKRK